jgi:hypothetical protein
VTIACSTFASARSTVAPDLAAGRTELENLRYQFGTSRLWGGEMLSSHKDLARRRWRGSRVFVDVDREPPEVVTAYRSSKIGNGQGVGAGQVTSAGRGKPPVAGSGFASCDPAGGRSRLRSNDLGKWNRRRASSGGRRRKTWRRSVAMRGQRTDRGDRLRVSNEFDGLRFQFGISRSWGGRRYSPRV